MSDLLVISWRRGIMKELVKRGSATPNRGEEDVPGTES